MISPFNLFQNMQQGKDTLKKQQVLAIWSEIEESKEAYKHKADLGNLMLCQASMIDSREIPVLEKNIQRELFYKASIDNYDKASKHLSKMKELTQELRVILQM